MSWMPPMSFSSLLDLALEHQRFLLDADLGAGLDLGLHVLQASSASP
jgi:hypothetical protein